MILPDGNVILFQNHREGQCPSPTGMVGYLARQTAIYRPRNDAGGVGCEMSCSIYLIDRYSKNTYFTHW